MRPKERIKIFFDLIDWNKLSKRWGLKKNISNHILNHKPYINVSRYWLDNYDQRIGQVLINLNLIEDNFRIWNDEETNILIDQGIELREILFWESYYDKNKNLLPKPINRIIKDLTTDHIKNILSDYHNGIQPLSELYIKAFKEELLIRSNKKKCGNRKRNRKQIEEEQN